MVLGTTFRLSLVWEVSADILHCLLDCCPCLPLSTTQAKQVQLQKAGACGAHLSCSTFCLDGAVSWPLQSLATGSSVMTRSCMPTCTSVFQHFIRPTQCQAPPCWFSCILCF